MIMERIIEVLESPDAKLCGGIAMVEDPAGDNSELHIRMARAAMQEYVRTVQPYFITSKIIHNEQA